MARCIAALLLLALSAAAHADSGVLIDHVPAGADRDVVMAVVRRALERHNWVITRTDADLVAATVDGHRTDASIVIRLVDLTLRYEGSATFTASTRFGSPTRPVDIPPRWLRELRANIGDAFATMSNKPKP